MEKFKDLLKKYIYIAGLAAVLAVCMFITVAVNKQLDGKIDKITTDREKEAILESIADIDTTGLNHYFPIWEQEIGYLCERLPKDYETEFNEHADSDEWSTQLYALIDEVKSVYMTDDEIYLKLKEAVPDELWTIVTDNYLQSITLLLPEFFEA